MTETERLRDPRLEHYFMKLGTLKEVQLLDRHFDGDAEYEGALLEQARTRGAIDPGQGGAPTMNKEITILRDRVEELERVLGVDMSLTNRLRDVFGLEPGLSPILGMLMKRAFVSHSSLYTVLYAGRPECDWPDAKVMDVQICKLRRKLRKHGVSIETRWGEGWSMPMADKSKVKAAIEAFGSDEALAAAAATLKARRVSFMESA